jgi:hypothetical protein
VPRLSKLFLFVKEATRFLCPAQKDKTKQTKTQMMSIEQLNLSDLVTTAGTQIRAQISAETVDEYATAMTGGTKFPPITVFHDGNRYILADGFHRVMAANRQQLPAIDAEVRKGTKTDALRYALGANASHGLRRTNADKRRSVELALTEWPQLSDRQIAEICAVSHRFISLVRRQVATVATCQAKQRFGADGKVYPFKPISSARCEDSIQPDKYTESDALQSDHSNEPSSEPQPELQNINPALLSNVEFHLNLVRKDAEVVLTKIQNDLIEPDDLGDCAVQLRFAAKTVDALKAAMKWPGIKQSIPRN